MTTVRHTRQNPVHVIGHARSGTSIFADWLRRYLQISFGTESQFIMRYHKKLARYGALTEDRNLRRLIDDIAQERCFQRWHKFDAFVLDPERLFHELPERSYRGVLEAAFKQLATHCGMPRWGDKSPEYIHALPTLYGLFPEAQYLHIVRDGRDVAMSIFLKEFGAKNVYKAASQWRQQLRLVQDFANLVKPGQLLELRYEDLLSNTDHELERVMTFLGVEVPPEVVEAMLKALKQEQKTNNFGKWQTGLSDAQQGLYEKIAGDVLSHYGYETRMAQSQPIPLALRAYWTVDNKIRRWLIPDYWRDNVYKGSLRVRSAISGVKNRGVRA